MEREPSLNGIYGYRYTTYVGRINRCKVEIKKTLTSYPNAFFSFERISKMDEVYCRKFTGRDFLSLLDFIGNMFDRRSGRVE